MRRLYALLPVVALAMFGTLSCDVEKENTKEETKEEVKETKEEIKEEEKEDPKEEAKEENINGPQVVTLDAEKVTFLVAKLYGRVSGLEGVALDFECGIEYSTDKTFSDEYSIRQKVDKKYTEDSYSLTILDVQPGKEYFYRAYYINQLMIYYGEVKTFTFDWPAPTVTTLSAELDELGNVVLKGLVKDKGDIIKSLSDYYPNGDYYGIECSTTESFEESSTTCLYPDRSSDKMENDSVICGMTEFNYVTTYYFRTFFKFGEIQNYGMVKSFNFEWRPRVVDLGLSVKWASCNIGATYPWDYGDYFAWGETETKTNYDWSTYKFCNGSGKTLTKYNNSSSCGTVDNKTVLVPEDDAAHVNWGGNWRMPTKTEFEELCNSDNCTWTWTTQNGMNGYLVTSKKSGHEGVSIFLPAAGARTGTDFLLVGSYGGYLSGSLGSFGPAYAFGLGFRSDFCDMGDGDRDVGLSIRPVCP